jgi:hypothetical protein
MKLGFYFLSFILFVEAMLGVFGIKFYRIYSGIALLSTSEIITYLSLSILFFIIAKKIP